MTEVEIKHPDDPELHLSDLSLGVGVVGDVDKVSGTRRVHLFYLGHEEHGSHTNQLKF